MEVRCRRGRPSMPVATRAARSCASTSTRAPNRIRRASGICSWTGGIRRSRSAGPERPGLHGGRFLGDEAELLADFVLDCLEDGGVVLQELLHVLAALPETLAAIGEPGAALLDDLPIHRQIERIAFARDAFAVHHV